MANVYGHIEENEDNLFGILLDAAQAGRYLHIKYAASQPTQDSDISDVPNKYIGLSVTNSTLSPTDYTLYTWYKWKGETGATAEVVQTTGTSEDNVMSQKAITDALALIQTAINTKFNISDVLQTTGTNTDKVMSQKAVTDALDMKVDKTSIVGVEGTDTTKVLSQAAVTNALETIRSAIDTKFAKVDVLQTTGANTDKVMSQKAVTDELANKANVDGYYAQMTVGNAEQLISPDGVSDNPENDAENNPFVFRTSAGTQSISDGLANIKKIRGKTYKWNQLAKENIFSSSYNWTTDSGLVPYTIAMADNVMKITRRDATGTSRYVYSRYTAINTYAGHKYAVGLYYNDQNEKLAKIGYQFGISTATRTSVPSVNIIPGEGYTLSISDTATFDNTVFLISWTVSEDFAVGEYFEFSKCKIVDLTAIYGSGNEPTTVEAFLHDYPMFNSYVPYTEGAISGIKPTSLSTIGFNAYNHTAGTAVLLGGNEYQITGAYTALSYSTGETITPDADGKFTPTADGTLTVTGGNATTTCVHLTWTGYRDGEYEAYWKQSITTHVADYFTDGMNGVGSVRDELTPTKAIKKFGIVDLGTLNWNISNDSRVYVEFPSAKPVASRSNLPNIMCARLNRINYSALNNYPLAADEAIAMGTTSIILLRSSSLIKSSMTTRQQIQEALSGIYLIYERKTYVETPINPPLNFNYRVSDFGTEEFVFASGNTALPVPCELFYQNNLVDKLRGINDLTSVELAEVISALD